MCHMPRRLLKLSLYAFLCLERNDWDKNNEKTGHTNVVRQLHKSNNYYQFFSFLCNHEPLKACNTNQTLLSAATFFFLYKHTMHFRLISLINLNKIIWSFFKKTFSRPCVHFQRHISIVFAFSLFGCGVFKNKCFTYQSSFFGIA